jgi:hypothetical protein
MNSGSWFIIVIPSILAVIFSVFVTVGIIADTANRAKEQQQQQQLLKRAQGGVAILMPTSPISSQNPNTTSSSPLLSPQIPLK